MVTCFFEMQNYVIALQVDWAGKTRRRAGPLVPQQHLDRVDLSPSHPSRVHEDPPAV